MFTNKQIANYFYKPVTDEYDEVVIGHFRCRCDTVRQQQPKSGYTNLMQHITAEHKDHEAIMQRAAVSETGSLESWTKRSSENLYGWLTWVINCNLPLHFCEKKETRRYTNLEPIGAEELSVAMEKVTVAVEERIKADMPESFGLIMDGWSHASEHFLAVFGCFMSAGSPCYPLLAMAPLINDDDDDHSAATHLSYVEGMLQRDYGTDIASCRFIVADNCSVNKRLACLMGVPLVGCASHRLNLAVREYLAPFESDLSAVQALMVKLKTLNFTAKLRFKTPLRPVLRQETRWSSTFLMVHRYFRLVNHIKNEDEVLDLLPSAAANRRLEKLLEELKKIESVSKAMQAEDVSLADVRVFFDGLIAIHEGFSKYLGPRANIVQAPDFESACVKILEQQAARLSRQERAAVAALRLPSSGVAAPASASGKKRSKKPEGKESFADGLKRAHKVSKRVVDYPLIQAIPATSNKAERFFSLARVTLGHERQAMLPITLERILFLRVNSNYWDLKLVNSCT